MARSDLLIALVKAGKGTPDPRFRQAVEALIAEERSKKHDVLAEQLSTAYNGSSNGQSNAVAIAPASIIDLVYELNPDRGLESLILPAAVVNQLRELIEEQNRSELLRSYGLAPRHRLLLVGPPGNGKTSVAYALAHELMVPVLVVRYEGLIGSYLGETASRLRKVFEYARQRRCVLFFDEFDTVGKERGDIHETGEIKRVVSTLLLWKYQVLFVVSAGNHLDDLSLPVPGASIPNVSDQDLRGHTLRAMAQQKMRRRLLAPAEAVNAVTVGAAHDQISPDGNRGNLVDLLRGAILSSPFNPVASGFRRAIKPDILVP